MITTLKSFFFINMDKNNNNNNSCLIKDDEKTEAEKIIDKQKNEPPKNSNESDFMNISDLLGGFITSYVYSAIIYLVYSFTSTSTGSVEWIVVSFGLAIMVTYLYKLISAKYKRLWVLQIFTLCLVICFSVGICSVLSLLNSYIMAFIIFLACMQYMASKKTHKLTRYYLFAITILSPVLLAWMYAHWVCVFEVALILTLTKIGFSVLYLDDELRSANDNFLKNNENRFQSYFVTLVLYYQIIYPIFMYWNDLPTIGTILSFFVVDHISMGILDSSVITYTTDSVKTFSWVLFYNVTIMRCMYLICSYQFKRLKPTVATIKQQNVSIHDFWHYVAAIR